MKIKIEEDYSKVKQFLKQNFSSPTHWPEWNLVVSKHFNTNFFYYTAYERDEPIGIFPVHETIKGRLKELNSGQLHFIPFGGWIFSKEVGFNLKKIPLPFNGQLTCYALPILRDFNVRYIEPYSYFKTLIVDLDQEIESIWNNELASKRRQNVKKAIKNDIEIRVDNSKDIDFFYDFYYNYSFKNNLTKDFFKDLFSLSSEVQFEVLWAKYRKRYLSSLIVAYDKNYSLYLFGINDKSAGFMGQAEILQWKAINIMKQKGCRYYDLCYIEPKRLPNIYRFKKGFSKKIYYIPLIKKRSYYYVIINKLNKLF